MKMLFETRTVESVWRIFGLCGARRETRSSIRGEVDPSVSRNPIRDIPDVSEPKLLDSSDSPTRLGPSTKLRGK